MHFVAAVEVVVLPLVSLWQLAVRRCEVGLLARVLLLSQAAPMAVLLLVVEEALSSDVLVVGLPVEPFCLLLVVL